MKTHQDIRGALEEPETLTYIKSLLYKRGLVGEVVDNLATDVAIEMLSTQEYYDSKFEYGLGTYIKLCINKVLRVAVTSADALDAPLMCLDVPAGEGVDNHDHPTVHDFFDAVAEESVDNKAGLPTFITQPGVASKMTYYLSQLTDRQSECFALKYVYGHTNAETADLLGIGIDAVKYHIKEARRGLLHVKASEEAYEAALGLGGNISAMSGRIISNNDAGNVWADQFWREENNVPGEVVVILDSNQP